MTVDATCFKHPTNMEKPITRYILMFCVGLVVQNDQNSHCYVVFCDAEGIGNSKQMCVTSS